MSCEAKATYYKHLLVPPYLGNLIKGLALAGIQDIGADEDRLVLHGVLAVGVLGQPFGDELLAIMFADCFSRHDVPR